MTVRVLNAIHVALSNANLTTRPPHCDNTNEGGSAWHHRTNGKLH